MNIDVRDAATDDADAVSALLDQLGYPAPPDVVIERMSRITPDSGRILLALRGDDIVGMMTLARIRCIHRVGDVCRITALVVEERARGEGVGRALVGAAEDHARSSGCFRVEVTSAARRTSAHAFYIALGYTDYPKRFIRDL